MTSSLMNDRNMIITAAAVLVLSLMLGTTPALAHRVVIFAWMEGDTVFTESRFPDGKKITGARISVFDKEKNLLIEGTTDSSGGFSFQIPKLTDLDIILDAGMGHQAEWHLSEAEIHRSVGSDGDKPENPAMKEEALAPAPGAAAETSAAPPQPASPAVLIDEARLEQLIEKAMDQKLDQKLQPIMRTLAQMAQPGPTVKDIFAGIGYILGLMGVAAYFLSRKTR